MSILGLGQNVFRKNLTGLKKLNADQITGDTINIPDGILNTSTVECNYMNVCYIEYPGGITNVSANLALVNQNVSIVPFINQSLTSLSYGAVSTRLVSFINSSLTSLSYGAVSTSLVLLIAH